MKRAISRKSSRSALAITALVIVWPGRVMAIVDSFEALTSTQFHRDAVPVDKAAEEIVQHAGKKYDPTLIEAFKKALPVMKKVRETYPDQLGDLINLDFAAGKVAPKAQPAAASVPLPPPKPAAPKLDVTALAKAAAAAKAGRK